jgi:5-methyltetrahydrofolate--homocysteine methyltransferase
VQRPNQCLADFIAPKGVADDYIGLFAVTAGLGTEKITAKFEAENDDYSGILFKSLADRLAEAFADICMNVSAPISGVMQREKSWVWMH